MSTAVAEKPKKKSAGKGKDKGKGKPAKKSKGAKASKGGTKGKGTRPAKDDARKVAKCSKDKLNTDQVRILRALRSAKGRELTRDDIKDAVGIGRDGKYSQTWLASLNALAEAKYMKINSYEGQRAFSHTLTKLGEQVLAASEKSFKESK